MQASGEAIMLLALEVRLTQSSNKSRMYTEIMSLAKLSFVVIYFRSLMWINPHQDEKQKDPLVDQEVQFLEANDQACGTCTCV